MHPVTSQDDKLVVSLIVAVGDGIDQIGHTTDDRKDDNDE